MSNCIICNNSHAPIYNKEEDGYYCNSCIYWMRRAEGKTFGWEELTDLLEDDSITYGIAEGGKEDGGD